MAACKSKLSYARQRLPTEREEIRLPPPTVQFEEGHASPEMGGEIVVLHSAATASPCVCVLVRDGPLTLDHNIRHVAAVAGLDRAVGVALLANLDRDQPNDNGGAKVRVTEDNKQT